MDISALNQKFGISESLSFSTGKGNLTAATITNKYASAVVSLYGAHVLSYRPANSSELLWMSEKSAFEVGKPIRGGIPVCFPWFGPHSSDSQKPPHGFARLMNWDVKSTAALSDGSTQIVLSLKDSAETKAIWEHSFEANITVTVGEKLTISLHYKNTGTGTFICSDALHTYFSISDLKNVSIGGLSDAKYFDGTASETSVQNEEQLVIAKEENRRYINHTGDCVISDAQIQRKIGVSKTGSDVTVVWNPFEATAKNIGDMHEGGYRTFVCVEAANAYYNAVTLAPREEWTISQSFGIL